MYAASRRPHRPRSAMAVQLPAVVRRSSGSIPEPAATANPGGTRSADGGPTVFDDLAHAVRVVGLVPLGVAAGVCQCVAKVAEFGDGAVDLADALVEEGHDVAADSGAAAAEIEDVADLARSEEHTSELQSRENLVCRLLL